MVFSSACIVSVVTAMRMLTASAWSIIVCEVVNVLGGELAAALDVLASGAGCGTVCRDERGVAPCCEDEDDAPEDALAEGCIDAEGLRSACAS